MKRLITLILTVCMVGSLFAGCGKKDTATSSEGSAQSSGEKKEELRIGVCLFTKNDEWLSQIANQFEAQCKEKGYEVNIQDGNQENEKQVQQIENFIAKQYDAIIVSAADVEGILPAIEKCQEANIPVIAIDTPIDHEWVSTCITWDNYKTGEQLGLYAKKYIEENLDDKEQVNIVMINAPAYPHLVKRDQGFKDALKDVAKAKVIVEQEANGSREQAANIVNNNIAKGIDMIYGVVDNHAWGAVTALEEASAEACVVMSCGGFGEEPFAALEADNKYYKALVVVPPTNIVSDSIIAVEKVMAGETVEKLTNIEFGLADHSNVADYR